MDLCLVEPDGLVRFTKGRASAFARLAGGRDHQHASCRVFLYDGLTETDDHAFLLQALQTRLNASVFDTGWGNRIHLDDPYYAVGPRAKRPEMPRNSRCADEPRMEE